MDNVFDVASDASIADQQMTAFAKRLDGPTRVFLRQASWQSSANLGGISYTRSDMDGLGSFWRTQNGVGGVWIDLRTANPKYTPEQLSLAGAIWNKETNELTYNLTYVNQHDDFDIVHNHGQLVDYRVDGVPLLSALPIHPGQSEVYTYKIDLTVNSGTYFIHSHWGMKAVLGMSAPLIIQADVPTSHPLATTLNDPFIQEILIYLEDWCLVFTNADDDTSQNTAAENGTFVEKTSKKNIFSL